MRAKNILYSLAAGFVAISISIAPAYAKDNFFKRSANAVKEFFSDDKKKDDSTPDKEKKEEKANPEKSGTTTTTQPESEKIDDKSVTELYDLSFEENKALPKLGNQRAKIREYQQIQAKKLLSSGQNIETTRNGEVIIATVAANDLFLPNDTTLRPTAAKVLRPYMEYLKEPDMYRMLLLMHSDNTGSEAYTNHLTTVRVSAVFGQVYDTQIFTRAAEINHTTIYNTKKSIRILPMDFFCDPAAIRTQDPQLRRLLLYPAELPDHLFQKCCKGTAIH